MLPRDVADPEGAARELASDDEGDAGGGGTRAQAAVYSRRAARYLWRHTVEPCWDKNKPCCAASRAREFVRRRRQATMTMPSLPPELLEVTAALLEETESVGAVGEPPERNPDVGGD